MPRPTEIDDTRKIETSIRILEGLGFSAEEQARFFGFTSASSADMLNAIRSFPKRLEIVFEILVKLDAMFYKNIEVQRRFMETAQEKLGDQAPKSMLITGDREQGIAVLGFLTRITG